MAKKQKTNTIEINGRRYDARTGKPVAHKSATEAAVAQPVTSHAPVAKPTAKQVPVKHHAPVAKPKRQVTVHTVRSVAAPTARKPQATRTLVRRAVTKPTSSRPQQLRAQSHTDTLVSQPANQVVPKVSVEAVNERRLKHAKGTPRSGLIRHFSVNHEERSGSAVLSAQPLPAENDAASLGIGPLNRTEQLLQQAVIRATSHQQPAHKPARRHLFRKHRHAA
ncbi:MAG TPA: hypothetical protein VG992_03115 [Candidatus Saccharimonadales bacterium]|nr:hypothetical protein [Candidatus Saccharimonadales bacterium]